MKWLVFFFVLTAAYGIAGPSGPEARPGLLVPDVPRSSTARRDRKHDETEPNHHHSHEFESKDVHGNSPPIDG